MLSMIRRGRQAMRGCSRKDSPSMFVVGRECQTQHRGLLHWEPKLAPVSAAIGAREDPALCPRKHKRISPKVWGHRKAEDGVIEQANIPGLPAYAAVDRDKHTILDSSGKDSAILRETW